MSEVINNLLSNAIKYSGMDTGIIVSVHVKENSHVVTEVMDQGRGILIEEQQKLFNYFQKTSTKPTAGEHSTGLGLAIAKKIIASHHGRIGVKSVFGQGSIFFYEFPVEGG